MIPTADEMAKALRSLGTILYRNNIINQSTYADFNGTVDLLRGNRKSWRYTVEASKPLKFEPFEHSRLDTYVYPLIYVDIEVDETNDTGKVPPFKELNATMEVKELGKEKTEIRIHIDLAEKDKETAEYQNGPLFHLQFGGHSPGANRSDEIKLREPRLAHPPMDLVLLCETVIANFYPEKWIIIKSQDTWQQLIHFSQVLCYQYYFAKINDCLSKEKPILNHIWASEWGKVTY